MHSFRRFSLPAGALALGIAAFAIAAPAASAATTTGSTVSAASPAHYGEAGAVFVQSDNPAGNQVAVYRRAADGTLTAAGTYATGGIGGVLSGSVVDHTASQGAVTYDAWHHLLYVVNAGSNTVSVFAVEGTNLSLSQVISSGGTFPVSVAVRGDVVYVLNAEAGGSIQGYRVLDGTLVAQAGWNRQLGLPTTGTPQFTNTPGQVGFTGNGSQLLVTTKAAGNSVYVYRLGWNGSPSAQPTINSLPGTVPFDFVDTGWNQIALVLTGPGQVATYTVTPEGTLEQIQAVATNQAATCWIAGSGDLLYASNAGSASETGLRVGFNGSLTDLGNTATDAGTVDATASSDGRNLYIQAGAAGIVDEYSIGQGGALTEIGSVTVPNAAGAEGIAAN